MIKKILVTVLAFSSVSVSTLPAAWAQTSPTTAPVSTTVGKQATLPAGTVISVTHQQGGLVPVKKNEATPLQQLVVAQSVKGPDGQVLIHAGTPVIGQMKATKGGGQIVIDKIVVDNRLLSFEAVSIQALPVTKVAAEQFSSGNDQVQRNLSNAASQIGRNLTGSRFGRGGGVLTGVGGSIGSSVVGSLFSRGPKKIKVVQLAAGQPYMLTTESAMTVTIATNPPSPPAIGVGGQQQGPGGAFPSAPGAGQFPQDIPSDVIQQGFPNF